MAQLASIATLVGTGASIYGNIRQGQQQEALAKARQQQAAARNRQAQLAQEIEARQRDTTLQRSLATTRARLGASGVGSTEGSGAALVAGLQQDAAQAGADSDAMLRARLAAGRGSLLNTDGSFTSYLRAGQGFTGALKSLLD
jgi:hypothetical protein